ncbi:MAG: cytidine deaminase [Fimbriimonas sp.]|nr:cytidine deaminase [Fimbriimonas sp.]
MVTYSELLDEAWKARARAYAPYSGYFVGAAILDTEGRVWTGCNIEYVAYGLCLCAERTALSKMVSEGVRSLFRVAVVTRDGGFPCGMCLQALLEFAGDPKSVEVIVASELDGAKTFRLSDLLPFGFQTGDLKRT